LDSVSNARGLPSLKLLLIALLSVAAVVAIIPRKPQVPSERKPRRINPAIPPVSAELKVRPPQPQTLQELLTLSPEQLEQVDLATINLLCATGLRGAENLDVQQHLDTLDQWAKHVARETLRNFHRFASHPDEYGGTLASYRMMMLATVLQEDFQAHYSPERAEPQLRGKRESSDAFFGDSQDVFLHGLLGGKRTGTCASLPVLYAAVAQRLGYPVTLAATKEHLYVRYDDGDERLNIEATSIGFKTFPDEYYRQWPSPVSNEEARTYGWLRPLSKHEVLGDFLTTRAHTLSSMKRFDAAAESWTQAAARLPQTPVMQRLVQRAQERAANDKAADRWDELWAEVAKLPVPENPEYAAVRDRQLRVHRFMSRNTNLPEIEMAVAALRTELDEAFKQEALAADSPRVPLLTPTLVPAPDPRAVELLAATMEAMPGRIRIPAESVPLEYWQGFPPALQERLRGLRKEQEIISEIHAFHVQEINVRNRAAMDALHSRPTPLPQNVRPEWLPAEYREAVPAELRNRLAVVAGKQQVEWTVRQYQTDQAARQRAQAMMQQRGAQLPLTGPPVQIEIVQPPTGKP